MRKHGMPAVHGSEVNVTPLIDVVMCLIIFFMLVAKIGISKGEENVNIPETEYGIPIKDLGNTLVLNVEKPDDPTSPYPKVRALVKGQMQSLPIVELGPNNQPLTESYKGEIEAKSPLLSVLRDAHTVNKNLQVIFRADEDLEARFITPVFEICAEAGIKTSNFNTKPAAMKETHG